ncbi:hypothetical protein N9368_00130 [Alphaproteobacteria bacterium]|nr:hypothetical protein [Alphaproteobacteria bacterium]
MSKHVLLRWVANTPLALPLMVSLMVSPAAVAPVSSALAADNDSNSAISASDDQNTRQLVTRQQERMGMLETDLKDLRNIVDRDLRQLKMQISQLSNSTSSDESEISGDIRAITNQLERLTDSIAMTNRRMERTLEITSDVEFRLLRMEKRLQTLITLGGDDVANAAVQQDTIAGGAQQQVEMSRNASDGSVNWSVDKQALDEQLALNNPDNNSGEAAQQNADAAGDDTTGAGTTDLIAGAATTNLANAALANDSANGDASTGEAKQAAPAVPVAPAKPEILPDVSPEEQYRFALSRALQNDLETAELAFAEFRSFNKGHSREADAAFWLGRVQFMRGQYEKAAMTFSEFNSIYPGDARLVDTTMWIAESVSHFAPQEQACAIYASLPKLLDSPPDSFYTRLDTLSKASNCGG